MTTLPLQELARLPAPNDNCAIVTRRVERGTRVRANALEFTLSHTLLEGHRFAVREIARGEALLSWGLPFGMATRALGAGEYVINAQTLDALRERRVNFELPAQPNFENYVTPYHFDASAFVPGTQVLKYDAPRHFLGYRRSPARGVGTRNMIVVLGLSSRAASFARALALRMQSACADFENIDGIAAVAHTEGSGSDPLNNFPLLLRTLAGLMVHPNVGAVLAVDVPGDGVTQRELRAYLHAENYPLADVTHAWFSLRENFEEDLARGAEIVRGWLPQVNTAARTPEPLTHLKIALQCGGSDAFSGISGNPLAGAVAREIVRHGGSANLAETDELIGAEEYILQNTRDLATARAFLETIEQFKTRLTWHGVSAEGNPSGGNRFRGLYNIALKSLGAAMKKDPALRLDYVIEYGERMTNAGFYFMDSPGNDLESIAGQIAAGCNLIFFITGNGSITNFPFVPTLKFVTTTGRYHLLQNEMDVNAGAYLDGASFDELTRDTFERALAAANGTRTLGERAGHSQISIWRNWRQTALRPNVFLEMPAPSGEPLPVRAPSHASLQRVITMQRVGEQYAREFVGLIVPTSLCASEVARVAVNELNRKGVMPTALTRFVTLNHTEGCGVSGDAYLAMLKRTLLDYMQHPMARAGLYLEHGCELTHNDSMRHRLQAEGRDPRAYGWASIQLDGGMEKVLQKIEQWFATRLDAADAPVRERVGLEKLRVGMTALAEPPAAVSKAFALLAREIAHAGGTVMLPSNAALLKMPAFTETLLQDAPRATMAYGQFAARSGLHIMDAPSQHWVETLSGLGATGAQIIFAYDTRVMQGHPFIPVVRVTSRVSWEQPALPDFDVVLDGETSNAYAALWDSLEKTLRGEISPRALLRGDVDFQITRGWTGVSV